MDDPELVRETAAQFVADMGENAVAYLSRQAELAAAMGDVISEGHGSTSRPRRST